MMGTIGEAIDTTGLDNEIRTEFCGYRNLRGGSDMRKLYSVTSYQRRARQADKEQELAVAKNDKVASSSAENREANVDDGESSEAHTVRRIRKRRRGHKQREGRRSEPYRVVGRKCSITTRERGADVERTFCSSAASAPLVLLERMMDTERSVPIGDEFLRAPQTSFLPSMSGHPHKGRHDRHFFQRPSNVRLTQLFRCVPRPDKRLLAPSLSGVPATTEILSTFRLS